MTVGRWAHFNIAIKHGNARITHANDHVPTNSTCNMFWSAQANACCGRFLSFLGAPKKGQMDWVSELKNDLDGRDDDYPRDFFTGEMKHVPRPIYSDADQNADQNNDQNADQNADQTDADFAVAFRALFRGAMTNTVYRVAPSSMPEVAQTITDVRDYDDFTQKLSEVGYDRVYLGEEVFDAQAFQRVHGLQDTVDLFVRSDDEFQMLDDVDLDQIADLANDHDVDQATMENFIQDEDAFEDFDDDEFKNVHEFEDGSVTDVIVRADGIQLPDYSQNLTDKGEPAPLPRDLVYPPDYFNLGSIERRRLEQTYRNNLKLRDLGLLNEVHDFSYVISDDGQRKERMKKDAAARKARARKPPKPKVERKKVGRPPKRTATDPRDGDGASIDADGNAAIKKSSAKNSMKNATEEDQKSAGEIERRMEELLLTLPWIKAEKKPNSSNTVRYEALPQNLTDGLADVIFALRNVNKEVDLENNEAFDGISGTRREGNKFRYQVFKMGYVGPVYKNIRAGNFDSKDFEVAKIAAAAFNVDERLQTPRSMMAWLRWLEKGGAANAASWLAEVDAAVAAFPAAYASKKTSGRPRATGRPRKRARPDAEERVYDLAPLTGGQVDDTSTVVTNEEARGNGFDESELREYAIVADVSTEAASKQFELAGGTLAGAYKLLASAREQEWLQGIGFFEDLVG